MQCSRLTYQHITGIPGYLPYLEYSWVERMKNRIWKHQESIMLGYLSNLNGNWDWVFAEFFAYTKIIDILSVCAQHLFSKQINTIATAVNYARMVRNRPMELVVRLWLVIVQWLGSYQRKWAHFQQSYVPYWYWLHWNLLMITIGTEITPSSQTAAVPYKLYIALI